MISHHGCDRRETCGVEGTLCSTLPEEIHTPHGCPPAEMSVLDLLRRISKELANPKAGRSKFGWKSQADGDSWPKPTSTLDADKTR